MESRFDDLGLLFGAASSTMASESSMGGGMPFSESIGSHGSHRNSLQLAPIYSSHRHHEGDTQYPHGESNFYGDYEDEEETYSNVDVSGIHVGARMSRTHHTPFGPARSNIGMQMSIGENGITMSTRSSSSIGFGGGRMLMLSFGGCSRPHQLGQRMYDPMGSLFSPFGGLFLSHSGLPSSMSHAPPFFGLGQRRTGSHFQEENKRTDGPIIEEIIDEEETGESGSKNDTALSIIYKQDDIDESLGLGLLPDEDTVRNSDRNKPNETENNGILNDFAFSEETPSSNNSNRNTSAKKYGRNLKRLDGGNTRRNKNVNIHQQKTQIKTTGTIDQSTSLQTDTNMGANNFEEQLLLFSRNSSKDDIDGINSVQPENDGNAKLESKAGQKFAKQEFKNIPLRLDDGLNNLSFLASSPASPVAETSSKTSSTKPLADNRSVHKQSKKNVNKNSFVRRRQDSTDSTSSLQGKQIDTESTKSHNITPYLLDMQSFPTTSTEDMNSVTSHVEMTNTAEVNLSKETTDASCESAQEPTRIENSESTEKVLYDDVMHQCPSPSVDFTEEAVTKPSKTDDVISDTGTGFEQNGFNRDTTSVRHGVKSEFVDDNSTDGYPPMPNSCVMPDKINRQSSENKGSNEEYPKSFETDTIEEANNTNRQRTTESNNKRSIYEQENGSPYKDKTLSENGKCKVDSESKPKDNFIDSTTKELGCSISGQNEDTGIDEKSATFSFVLEIDLDNSTRKQTRSVSTCPNLVIFTTKPEIFHTSNSNKPITNFMSGKERKDEAGEMFQVNHFEDRRPTDDANRITLDYMCQQNKSPSIENNFTEETDNRDSNTFKHIPELRGSPEDERASPELEMFNFESHNAVELNPAVDPKQNGKRSERKSNIKPLKNNKQNADDNEEDFNFDHLRDDVQNSPVHKAYAGNIQWEYPGQRSTFQESNIPNQNAKQNNPNTMEDLSFDAENKNKGSQNRTLPHDADSFSRGGNRHRESNRVSESDLSNLSTIRPGQRTNLYRDGNKKSGQNVHSYHGRDNNPHSEKYSHPNKSKMSSPKNIGAFRSVGNRYRDESEEEWMQSSSPSNYGDDDTQAYDHMCPHMILQAQCEHKHIYRAFHQCCNAYHYFCDDCDKQMSLKEYNMRKRGIYLSNYGFLIRTL